MSDIFLSQSQQLTRLVANLLEVSQIKSGHLELNFEVTDLRKVTQEVIDLVAVLNALRTSRHSTDATDFEGPGFLPTDGS